LFLQNVGSSVQFNGVTTLKATMDVTVEKLITLQILHFTQPDIMFSSVSLKIQHIKMCLKCECFLLKIYIFHVMFVV
jgi:hypothetical protein